MLCRSELFSIAYDYFEIPSNALDEFVAKADELIMIISALVGCYKLPYSQQSIT